MQNPRQILIVGSSSVLEALAAILRASPSLHIVTRSDDETLSPAADPCPDVILVDAAQVTPEQFRELIAIPSRPPILSVDPETYQLTVLPSPNRANPLAETAWIIGLLSSTLPRPA